MSPTAPAGRPRRRRRHRRLQGRASCCGCSPSPATTSASCPPRRAASSSARRPGRRCPATRSPPTSGTTSHEVPHVRIGQAGRPRRRRPGHRRPARQGRARPGRRPAHQHPAHRALPGGVRAGDAHRDVGAPGHPGQRRDAARARRRRARARPSAGSPAPTPARAGCPSPAEIFAAARRAAGRRGARPRDLAGRHVVVSRRRHPRAPRPGALPRQPLVSGRQGYALARTAAARGAEVTLVAANVALPDPAGVDGRPGRHRRASCATPCSRPRADADAVVMAAAVADFRPGDARRHEDQEGRPASPTRSRWCATPTSWPSSRRRAARRARWSSASPPRPATPRDVLAHGRAKLAAQGLRPARRQRGRRRTAAFEAPRQRRGRPRRRRHRDRGAARQPKEALADAVWDLVAARLPAR